MYRQRRLTVFLLASLFTFFSTVSSGDTPAWMTQQETDSIRYLLANVSPSGAAPGSIVASPSRVNPDYFFHWIRDAALTSEVLITLYQHGDQSRDYDRTLRDYVDFSLKLQSVPNPSGGLGEPKFNVDGTAYTDPWGRPQNDGPALRAAAMIRLARIWLGQGKQALVREKLYDSKLPATTLIKVDLEYVAHHWRDASFDLWEEERGDHFYTRMAQRRAMVEGAALARELGDGGAADYYEAQARALETEIGKHWNGPRHLIEPTLNWTGGCDYKHSGIDSAVILGVLHGHTDDGFYSYSDDQVLATVHAQEIAFRNAFPINQRGLPAVAIGRYPEDRYNGTETSSLGNPWLLTTMAFGELYHRAATEIEAKGRLTLNDVNHDFFAALLGSGMPSQPTTIDATAPLFARVVAALRQGGDAYLNRGHYHGQPNGHFAEQLNRDNGYMQSAADLTWSYASYLTAYWSR